MILYKIFVTSIYKFLFFLNDGILYKNSIKEARLHTFLVFTFFNTINAYTIASFLYFYILGVSYSGLTIYAIPIFFFILNYIILYKRGLFIIIQRENHNSFNMFYLILTFIYILLTIGSMLLVGNYIRSSTIS